MKLKVIAIVWVSLFSYATVSAQVVSENSEINAMFMNGIKAEVAGKYSDAITTYRQLLNLEPDNQLVVYQLATLYYRNADFESTARLLHPLAKRHMQKEEVYQLLAASQNRLNQAKKALATLSEGSKLFPSSGLLYYESGRIYESIGNPTLAFLAYIKGIELSSRFLPNYKAIASDCIKDERLLWRLIYGETYLLLKKDTIGNAQQSACLWMEWKQYFEGLAEKSSTRHLTDFEKMVWDLHLRSTPTLSAGFTITNFAEARKKMLISWKQQYREQFPFFLFDYYCDLVEAGMWELYIEHLFYVPAGITNNNVNPDFERLLNWQAAHPLRVTSHVNYVSSQKS